MTDTIRELKNIYRTGKSDLRTDFFKPCLAACTRYRRAAGYFSSSALRTWAHSLPRILQENARIQLLISPALSSADADAIQNAVSDESRQAILRVASDRLLEEAIRFASNPENQELQLKLFCWMVATGHIELRFALPKHIDDAGIFHDKCGIFDFESGDRVAFTGSANETASGHSRNTERLHVFRSWVPEDGERLAATVEDFESIWDYQDPSIVVIPISEEALKFVRENAPTSRPCEAPSTPLNKWRHQDEALEAFLKVRRGILEMATGTGKTRTSLKILTRLIKDGVVRSTIICTVGNDLLDQWHKEVLAWKSAENMPWRVLRDYGRTREAEVFGLDPDRSVLVISRQQLPNLFKLFDATKRATCLIVHDEVHGLGSEASVGALKGEHAAFGFAIGLSATPEREYDTDGTQFISDELGPVIFRFGLEDAIARGILCEMNYVPLYYDLSPEDKRRLQAVYAKKSARAAAGNPMSDTEFYTDLARVYKTAENKPIVFKNHLRLHPESLKRAIVFVESKLYGDEVLRVIEQHTHLYKTYYDEDHPDDLKTFARGGIDCLVTCHRISQGVDIQSLTTVVLFASARAKLETIQRIGRCLRLDPASPNKRATVIDFVSNEVDSDIERSAWLMGLASIRREG